MEIANVDVIASGLKLLLQPGHLMWLPIGMLVGLIIGAIPGFNDTNFLAMALPFTVYMGPINAVVFMMACFCASQAAGSLPARETSILANRDAPGLPWGYRLRPQRWGVSFRPLWPWCSPLWSGSML